MRWYSNQENFKHSAKVYVYRKVGICVFKDLHIRLEVSDLISKVPGELADFLVRKLFRHRIPVRTL